MLTSFTNEYLNEKGFSIGDICATVKSSILTICNSLFILKIGVIVFL